MAKKSSKDSPKRAETVPADVSLDGAEPASERPQKRSAPDQDMGISESAVTSRDIEAETAAPLKEKQLGTSKAVETMFRNATRAELELIALAATKANIMISLNGLIISALMISGAFIFAQTAAFLLPAGVFMITAAGKPVYRITPVAGCDLSP